jgi:hypothetical protein
MVCRPLKQTVRKWCLRHIPPDDKRRIHADCRGLCQQEISASTIGGLEYEEIRKGTFTRHDRHHHVDLRITPEDAAAGVIHKYNHAVCRMCSDQWKTDPNWRIG